MASFLKQKIIWGEKEVWNVLGLGKRANKK